MCLPAPSLAHHEASEHELSLLFQLGSKKLIAADPLRKRSKEVLKLGRIGQFAHHFAPIITMSRRAQRKDVIPFCCHPGSVMRSLLMTCDGQHHALSASMVDCCVDLCQSLTLKMLPLP